MCDDPQVPRLMQKYLSNLEKKTMKLTETMYVKDYPPGDVQDAVQYGYQSSSIIASTISVLTSSIIASRKPRFILSRSLLLELFERDPNLTQKKNLSGDQMRKIMGQITEMGFIKRVTESTKTGGQNRRAATYEVIDEEILALIPQKRPSSKAS